MKNIIGNNKIETAVFGAGCFWGVEERFSKMKGVVSTTVGYAGGTKANPTYEDVLTHKTGHAETVKIEFDPKKISYEELLSFFFKIHDPTTSNRQGPDIGSNYRSMILYTGEKQKSLPKNMSENWSGKKIHGSNRNGDQAAGKILAGGRIPPKIFRKKYGQIFLSDIGRETFSEQPSRKGFFDRPQIFCVQRVLLSNLFVFGA